ncbi:ATP-binding cassette domain-containing protein [Candidatus Woesebacteria bacterium]|nr:ATP-binding cassette domain-containing protein [Candidatus Woesebacteria bacterium]
MNTVPPQPREEPDRARTTEDTIIEVRYLSKYFVVKSQNVDVLRKIEFKIKRGEFVALFGPSGCGKSTLLHIVLGLEKPSTGLVILKGQELYLLDEDGRARFRKKTIGMIYQQSNWIKSLSVIENVAFMGSLLGHPRRKALALAKEQLERVGMYEWADYRPMELSSGQQQKVSLARALLNNPDIIIADEPTGNLDYRSGVELMQLFASLSAAGKTILMVTHNIDNVDYTTQVVQMFDGKIIGNSNTKSEDLQKLKTQIIDNISQAQSRLPAEAQSVTTTVASKSGTNKAVIKQFSGFFKKRKDPIGPLRAFIRETIHLFRFSGYLFYFFVARGIDVLRSRIGRFIPILKPKEVIEDVSLAPDASIRKSDLIEMAVKNMFAKKTRTFVTIGGMAIGICLIVFLISIGYGVEQLVISRVARLEETKQIDVSPIIASNVTLTDKSLADMRALSGVTKVLPVIGIVGKVRSNSATTDVAVYGVSPDYLKESAIRPAYGSVFDTGSRVNVKATQSFDQSVDVSASSPSKGKTISAVKYQASEDFLRVREGPATTSAVLGYTKLATASGSLVWGDAYDGNKEYGQIKPADQNETFGYWIQSDFPLWKEKVCNGVCASNDKYEQVLDLRGTQKIKQGYIAVINIETDFSPSDLKKKTLIASVETPTPVLEATDQASLVERQLKELTLVAANSNTKQMQLSTDTKRYAYVNATLLDVLGLDPKTATGKTIELALVATNTTLNQKLETNFLEYTISGVTTESNVPILYSRIEDTQELGLQYYSQAKVVVDSQDNVAHIRKQLESLGFRTTSVVDTIAQIEGLFASIRLLLSVLGVVALSVAALGMFNTLTVSMLERTHEVGMMKAVGMVSKEVKELFLAESMVMGILGGIMGLIMGIVAGRLLSLVISVVSVSRGAGFINISYLPIDFVILIVALSLVVGFVTGMYPASRATRISALDALRYE